MSLTVKYGWKIHTDGKKWGKDNTFGDTQIEKYADKILMNTPVNQEEIKWAKETYNWDDIVDKWNQELQ